MVREGSIARKEGLWAARSSGAQIPFLMRRLFPFMGIGMTQHLPGWDKRAGVETLNHVHAAHSVLEHSPNTLPPLRPMTNSSSVGLTRSLTMGLSSLYKSHPTSRHPTLSAARFSVSLDQSASDPPA
ncbi:hypothetical protein AcW1_005716 [Taiwanofungus camphoratus]|nr:hypothetical protein AcW1_005716 [Antrodia cinnamomea]